MKITNAIIWDIFSGILGYFIAFLALSSGFVVWLFVSAGIYFGGVIAAIILLYASDDN